MERSFPRKRKTKQCFGECKRKAWNHGKKKPNRPDDVPSDESEVISESSRAASLVTQDATELPSTSSAGCSTVSAHIVPRYVTTEEAQALSKTIAERHQEFASVSATEKKLRLTFQKQPSMSQTALKFTLIEIAANNNLLVHTLCKQCGKPGLTLQQSTKLGEAVKLVLSCPVCRDIIKKLTNYYSFAMKNNSSSLEEMQRTMMATFYHVSSTDDNRHHDLCLQGPDSWCKQQRAKARGEEPPPHRYKLPQHVCAAMLPIWKKLSDPALLQQCLGAKTQNSAEYLHGVIWSLLPKEQHASLFAVQDGVSAAIVRFNEENESAIEELSQGLSSRLGTQTLQRAEAKDARRLRKAKYLSENTKRKRGQKKKGAVLCRRLLKY
ncbi:hypothetical protein ISCGN_002998 [Ixodes scapularis]